MAGDGAGSRVRVGTSGFSYPSWRGPFYPPTLPASRMLAYYAERFPTVELNHTFRQMPTPARVAAWDAATPAGFRFAAKAPFLITHALRLRDAAEPLAAFLAVVRGLGPKLGPILFQLPPNLRADLERLGGFLARLPPGLDAVFEFRHPSWLDDATFAVLARHGAALCVTERDAGTTPLVATAAVGYVRLRRTTYTPRRLATWATRVRTERRWRRAYVYLRHDAAGRAPGEARRLAAAVVETSAPD